MLICLIISVLFSVCWFAAEGTMMPVIGNTMPIPTTTPNGVQWAADQVQCMNMGEWVVLFLNLSMAGFGFLYGFLMVHPDDAISYQQY